MAVVAFVKLLNVDTSKPFPLTTGAAEGLTALVALTPGVETGLETGSALDGELLTGELTAVVFVALGAVGTGTPAAALAAAWATPGIGVPPGAGTVVLGIFPVLKNA